MKLRTAMSGLLMAGIALPAFAQATGYWIVQDSSTKHCSIVTQRPVSSTMTVVGPDGVTYKTRSEAQDAMRTVKVCHED